METVFLKLGGSLITFKNKAYKADTKTINRLAKEIKEALGKKQIHLLIGHGGGSFPHTPAKKYSVHKGIINKKSTTGYALTQDAAARLNRTVMAALLKQGLKAASFPPSAWTITRKGDIEMAFPQPIVSAMKNGIIPVIYGDVVLDIQQGIAILSTEKILSYLSLELGANRVIMATGVDMVYTGDPKKKKKVQPVPKITSSNFHEIEPLLSGASETDVTGGMYHKVGSLYRLSVNGVECEIAGGKIKNNIKNALLGKPHKSTKVG